MYFYVQLCLILALSKKKTTKKNNNIFFYFGKLSKPKKVNEINKEIQYK